MTESQIETRNVELKNKKICRFCLSQNEPLSNIYSRENRLKSSAPLPLQVMACVSIEVFTNDGMPSTICDNCRMLMEHCYRFKQMCKKADNALRQFPLTGVWPANLELPKVPEELLQRQYPSAFSKMQPEIKTTAMPVDARPTPVKLVKATRPTASVTQVVQQKPSPGRPKLLNKNSNKILNRNAVVTSEPMLSEPKIKRDDAGNVELVTEIIEKYEEPDPIKTAAKVETNVFPCPHCERSFPLRQLLDIHMVNHNRERSFECEHCEKRFFSKYDLGKHMLIHTGEKPYKCVVCNKAFTRSTLLYRHEKIHTDQPKFLCVYCEKPFLSTDELEKHTERHRKNRPFSCKICGKRFAFKQGLERHETVHAKEQPYPCHYCELSFSTPSKLARHLTAHAGDRPFPCKLCPKSYLLSHHLTRHLRSHSQGSGSYKCYDCEKNFTTRDDLIYHSAVHATQTLVCPLCKEHFSDLELVTEHIKEHAEGEQYACEFCDLIFMTPEKLQTHRNSEHTDDLVAYKEHDNNQVNVKRESIITFDESSQEMQEGEVIQEFIIEEYHHDNQEEIVDSRIVHSMVKEEQEEAHDGPEPSKKRLSARSSGGQSDTSSSVGHIKEIKILSNDGTEDEDFDMEIETLERDEDAEYSYASHEELEPVEPPPPKMRKISPAASRREVQEEKPKVLLNNKNLIEEKTKKLRQPSISSVLQHLPKGVTIVKKEKSPKDKKAEIKEIRIINQAKPAAKTESSKQPQEAQKVLNVKPRLNEEKPHVENVKLKATKSPSPSVSKAETPEKPAKTSPAQPVKKLVEMMIGDKKVKVQKIMMTKAEVAAMAKEGKIEMKGGTMILKQDKAVPKVLAKK